MDLNPHAFVAPFSAYEVATHVQKSNAQLLLVSTAWLSDKLGDDVERGEGKKEGEPYWETLSYWITRLGPLLGREERAESEEGREMDVRIGEDGNEGRNGNEEAAVGAIKAHDARTTLVVIANRVGEEPGGLVPCDLETVKVPLELLSTHDADLDRPPSPPSSESNHNHDDNNAPNITITTNHHDTNPTAPNPGSEPIIPPSLTSTSTTSTISEPMVPS